MHSILGVITNVNNGYDLYTILKKTPQHYYNPTHLSYNEFKNRK